MTSSPTPLRIVAVAAMAMAAGNASAAHSVTPLGGSTTPETLVESLLGDSSGITVTPGSISYTGVDIASGLFSGAGPATGLPFTSGVLLTSGSVYNSVGPNTLTDATEDNGQPGSALLQSVTGIGGTRDASVLSFKFKSNLDKFSFQYVFASEEYNEYAPSAFNDVFAFILTDSAGTSINLAQLPDSSVVSINNVRIGNNPDFYYNNSTIDPLAPFLFDIQYDGIVGRNPGFLLYAVGDVIPNQEYTITLAIADTADFILDSGVFLKEGSFVSGPPTVVPEGNTAAAGLLLGVLGGYGLRRRRHAARA